MVPRALSVVFSGVSVATIVAVPLGSYLGGLYGWRIVFLLAAGSRRDHAARADGGPCRAWPTLEALGWTRC